MKLNNLLASAALASALALGAGTAGAQNVMVGGQSMLPTKNIVENAVNSAEHTTLVSAVKAAGLVDTLAGAGPFTVFAPTNVAFGKVPQATTTALFKPGNEKMLAGVLTYHVVPGRFDMAALRQQITAGGGKAMLKTANGGMLTAMMNGPTNIVVQDANGGVASISTYDVMQSNGVIHVVDRVLVPAM